MKPANPPPLRAGEPNPNDDDDYDIDVLTEVIHGDPALVEQLQKLQQDEQKAVALVGDLGNKLQEAKNAAREQKMAANQKARFSLLCCAGAASGRSLCPQAPAPPVRGVSVG